MGESSAPGVVPSLFPILVVFLKSLKGESTYPLSAMAEQWGWDSNSIFSRTCVGVTQVLSDKFANNLPASSPLKPHSHACPVSTMYLFSDGHSGALK